MPKIIQILTHSQPHEVLGLDDKGVTYKSIGGSDWEEYIKPLPTTAKKRGEQFKPPLVGDIESYMIELRSKNKLPQCSIPNEANAFHDYWESMGWKRNNKKMACWKASVRTWLNNARSHNEKRQQSNRSAVERVAAANRLNTDLTPIEQPGYIQPLGFHDETVRS